ncbi:MAG: hypothetical protein GAK32_01122 [Pseudomonas fluorescens]|nr:MAG: hypothetical protein GAK32_01122 [Pseudomonas fluorescens]
MRKVFLLALLVSPVALAQSISVETNSLMRLPSSPGVLQLDRLDVADYGTLLVPATVTQLSVDELHLGRDARIAIVPAATALQLQVRSAQLEHGSQITSRGAPGTHEKPARPGRDLTLRINALTGDELSVDARGGAGAQGYAGLDGANGADPGCTWGSAGRAGASGIAAGLSQRADQGLGRWRCRWSGGHGGQTGQGRAVQGLPGVPRRGRRKRPAGAGRACGRDDHSALVSARPAGSCASPPSARIRTSDAPMQWLPRPTPRSN